MAVRRVEPSGGPVVPRARQLPAEAEKQIGVISATQGLRIVVAVIVGVPLAVGLIVLIAKSLGH